MKRVLCVASIGGHWVQLLRIARGLEGSCELSYASTHAKCATMVTAGATFYELRDFNRWNAWWFVPAFFRAVAIVWRSRADVVVTTGAAPGLVMLLAARLLLRRAVWVDSIANVEHMSLNGRAASWFANRCYTQWPELAGGRVRYAGNVLGVKDGELSEL